MSCAEAGEPRKNDTVQISSDYLVYLHDMLAERDRRLEQMFGGSAKEVLIRAESEQVASTLTHSGVMEPGLDGALKAMRNWGMSVTTDWLDHTLTLEVGCPYAKTVHPRLATEEPVCPLGVILGGVVRAEDSKAIVKQFVNGTGVGFTIHWNQHPELR